SRLGIAFNLRRPLPLALRLRLIDRRRNPAPAQGQLDSHKKMYDVPVSFPRAEESDRIDPQRDSPLKKSSAYFVVLSRALRLVYRGNCKRLVPCPLPLPPCWEGRGGVRGESDPDMWTWAQHWRALLFLHWQIPPASVQPFLPSGLDLDTRD